MKKVSLHELDSLQLRLEDLVGKVDDIHARAHRGYLEQKIPNPIDRAHVIATAMESLARLQGFLIADERGYRQHYDESHPRLQLPLQRRA
jgi:hypothetical protein